MTRLLIALTAACLAACASPPIHKLDRNSDARVTREELQQALKVFDDEEEQRKLTAIVKACDTDGAPGFETSREQRCLLNYNLATATAGTLLEDAAPQRSWRAIVTFLLAVTAGLIFGWLVSRLASRTIAWALPRRWTHGAWFRLPSLLHFAIALTATIGVAYGWALALSSRAILPEISERFSSIQIVLASAIVLGLLIGLDQSSKSRRIRSIEGTSPPQPAPGPAARGKAIVICCDGTGNSAGARAKDPTGAADQDVSSNVWRLYSALETTSQSGWNQVKWYDDGVGTNTSRTGKTLRTIGKFLGSFTLFALPARVAATFERFSMLTELAFGVGITENITQAYTEIIRQYRPGDRIYLFGFSRGAYTARCLAGVIDRAGLLKSEHVRYAPDVVQLFRYRPKQDTPINIRGDLRHASVEIEFLGVWDTVASLGVPLWGWSFRIGRLWSNIAMDSSPLKTCKIVRHALSIDEERSQFVPTLFDEPNGKAQPSQQQQQQPQGQPDVQQVWFRGSHSGVGGGYVDSELSDVSLGWMMNEALASGLTFTKQPPTGNHLGAVYTQIERQRFWQLTGSWPRWHPCHNGTQPSFGYGTLHQSVRDRAVHARKLRASNTHVASDELLVVGTGAHATPSALVKVRADRAWNRTGVVLEQGHYRISYRGGSWRDKDCTPCGAAGQGAGVLDPRLVLGWGRRLPDAQWMELILHVAHPRQWPMKELSGRRLFYYVVWRDPIELRQTVVRAGEHLRNSGDRIQLSIESSGGLLYGFANDWWLAYANNSGSVDVEVEAITQPDPDLHRFVINQAGVVN